MNHHEHHKTATEDRVPISQKVGFGIGALVSVIAINAVAGLTQLYLNVGLKISPVLVGVVMSLPRLWDAVTDPIVGNLSDNTRSRWGRRIPYVLCGAILVGLLYATLWMTPRDWGDVAKLVYFLGMSLLFYTAITIYSIPQNALGLEMTNDYHERTRVFSYSAFFISVGGFALPCFYWLANRSCFADEVEGLKWVGSGVGIALMLCGLTCALICKEGKCEQAMKQEKVGLWESFTTTCKNRSFLWLISIIILITVGFTLVAGLGNYVTIYYLYAGNKAEASALMVVFGWVWAFTTMLGIIPMNWISKKIGKLNTILMFVIIMSLGNISKILCYNPEHPYLILISGVMLSSGTLVMYTLGAAIMADICDEEELNTGKRSEGMYSAAYGWWLKVGTSLAIFIAGVILQSTGFDAKLETQDAVVLYLIRVWDIGLPTVLCLVGIYLLIKCPLSEERAYEVKALLEKRRQGDS